MTHADIFPGFITDHSMITLNVALHSNPRGKGFWKLNTSLLSEMRYVQEIKTAIESTGNQYKDDTSVNPALLWEMIKLKVRAREINILCCTQKCENKKTRRISLLEKHLDNSNNCNPSYHMCTLKLRYEIEIKSGDTKKWKPLAGYMKI